MKKSATSDEEVEAMKRKKATPYDYRMSMRISSTRRDQAKKIAKAISQDETFVMRWGLRYALERFDGDPMALLRFAIKKQKQDEKESK